MSALLRCEQVVKVFRAGTNEVTALQGLDFAVDEGEMVGVIGASGSGKSTLLSLLAGVTQPTGGSVTFDGVELARASRAEMDRYRRVDVGILWQDSSRNLVPYLTALQNVMTPLAMAGVADVRDRAEHLMTQVGLGDRHDHLPRELSGGEQQRVGLAIALSHEPRVLLADEPTGELDRATTESVFGLMRSIGDATGIAQVIVSHDAELTRYVDRVVSLRDGRIATEQRRSSTQLNAIDEVALVDSIGRLQLTPEQQAALGNSGRVTVDIVDGEIRIRPA